MRVNEMRVNQMVSVLIAFETKSEFPQNRTFFTHFLWYIMVGSI